MLEKENTIFYFGAMNKTYIMFHYSKRTLITFFLHVINIAVITLYNNINITQMFVHYLRHIDKPNFF